MIRSRGSERGWREKQRLIENYNSKREGDRERGRIKITATGMEVGFFLQKRYNSSSEVAENMRANIKIAYNILCKINRNDRLSAKSSLSLQIFVAFRVGATQNKHSSDIIVSFKLQSR